MTLSSHVKRWLTGLTALPILIFWLGWGSPLMFALLIALVCLLSLREYFQMAFSRNAKDIYPPLAILGYTTGLSIIWAAYSNSSAFILVIITINFLLCGFFLLPRYKTEPSIVDAVAMQIQGMVYIPVLIASLIHIRNTNAGILWIFFLLAIVFAGDIGAYYAGSYLGRHKLCPSVSPKKTIEGSIGGLCANLLVGGTIKAMFLPSLPWAACMVMFLLIGAAGQIGDLYESALKRSVQIKDSGTLLPGHGGILDRIDALLFASPVALIFKEYILY
ncbi:MAG: phosphatidate cytidylyltransferase [Deltaproteobacteria bacterium]|nr:phosphatidate cytidylyltransferase [Deltaproteobacteria bacterium]